MKGSYCLLSLFIFSFCLLFFKFFPPPIVFSVYDQVLAGLKKAYGSILTRIGDPLDDGTLYGTYMFLQIKTEFVYTFCLLFLLLFPNQGPMHSKVGVEGYKKSIEEAVATGGKIEFGGNVRLISI